MDSVKLDHGRCGSGFVDLGFYSLVPEALAAGLIGLAASAASTTAGYFRLNSGYAKLLADALSELENSIAACSQMAARRAASSQGMGHL